jgi:hypothetical protein
MTKYLLTLVTLFLLCQPLFAKSPKDSIESFNKIRELEKEIDDLKLKVQDINDFKKDQEDIVKQTSQTINNQNSLISSFGIIYTILTIIITIIAIGLPIIVYQFGIRPSKEALEKLENNLDEKVADYLKDNRKRQIEKSILYLKGEDAELKGQAITFLSLTQHEGFSDQEMFEFYRLIKSKKLSDTHIGTMAYLLSSRENEYANEIFGDVEQLKNNSIKTTAYQYIPKIGVKNFIGPLKSLISDSKNQYGEFITLLSLTNMYSSSATMEILSNKELIDCLTEDTLKQMKPHINQTLVNSRIDLKEFEKSYLGQKMA